MRRYDDPVHVRPSACPRPPVGSADPATDPATDPFSPGQFLWRGRLYLVRSVLAHWVEVGAWWRVRDGDGLPVHASTAGRQVWRVEAGSGRVPAGHTSTSSGDLGADSFIGVFDLTYDANAEPRGWRLARALD